MASALGYIRRSLAGPLVFLAMGFIAVPSLFISHSSRRIAIAKLS